MPASVLVGYATRYGSTQEVAEAVAATLRERGLEVDTQPMQNVRRHLPQNNALCAKRRLSDVTG